MQHADSESETRPRRRPGAAPFESAASAAGTISAEAPAAVAQRAWAAAIRQSPRLAAARAARENFQGSPRSTAQRQTIQAVFGASESQLPVHEPVVQLNKWKTAKNILSFGIRKAYVNHKRNAAAAAAHANAVAPQQQDDQASPLDRFVEAYEKSRYYHRTNPAHLPSIEEHGLLNYDDRQETLGHQVAGMSAVGGEFKGDERKGVFLGPKPFMQENRMTTNVARAFLPSERTKVSDWWDEATVPSHELYLDEKFRGGAVITKDSIPPEQVTTGNMSDLLDQGGEKLDSILASVASQYGGDAPNPDDMKGLLRQALRERRLSNAAFDNAQ